MAVDFTKAVTFEELLSTVNGLSIGELLYWTEHTFIGDHVTSKTYKPLSSGMIKNAALRVGNFFLGENNLYEGLSKDIQICMLAMQDPSDYSKHLFEYVFEASGQPLEVPGALGVANPNNYTDNLPSTSNQNNELAEDIEENLAVENSIIQPLDGKSQRCLWTFIYKTLQEIADEEVVKDAAAQVINLLGLMCMHSFKLFAKKTEFVQTAFNFRFTNHFKDIYRGIPLKMPIVPPHPKAITQLGRVMFISNVEYRECHSLMIARLMIENSLPNPNNKIKELLLESCLMHTQLTGFAALNLFEQAATAVGFSYEEFRDTICTSRVAKDLDNIFFMYKLAKTAPGSVKIKNTTVVLKDQISWKWSRLYNSEHFSRFKTKKMTHLIIRCASFLSLYPQGKNIGNMEILKSTMNKNLFEAEKAKSFSIITSSNFKGNKQISAQAMETPLNYWQ